MSGIVTTGIVTTGIVAGALATVIVLGLMCRPLTTRRESGPPPTPGPRASALARWGVRWRVGGGARRSRRQPGPRAVADWCDDLARRARGGATLREALATTAPSDDATRDATRAMRLALERGRTTSEAIAGTATPGGAHLELARRVIETTARLGGPYAASIDRTGAILRQRAADSEERSVQAAQARLSAQVLTAVPLLMLGLLVATDSDTRRVIASGVGLLCVAIGLTLNLAGMLWMRRLVAVPR